VVKVLDACSFNQRFWVFAAGLTNVAVDLTVADTATGETRTYRNPLSVPYQPLQDTSAFATCQANTAGAAEWRAARALETAPAAAATRPSGGGRVETGGRAHDLAAASLPEAPPAEPRPRVACAPGPQTLCLQGGRFRVESEWQTRQGHSGRGQAVPLTADTGFFWFFSATNVEQVVKVLDACAFNQRLWVFAAGLTDVEVTTTVTDTATGEARVYENPLGRPFQPVQDTSAFVGCP
jgi:hypothetical protein